MPKEYRKSSHSAWTGFWGARHNNITTIKSHGLGRYGRTIGEVILSNGQNLNHELVKSGMCWWYRKYSPEDEILSQLEQDAKDSKRGLWTNPSPIPPWVWRKKHK
ncbi:thermonuclease family protein [Nitrospinota bacterium]